MKAVRNAFGEYFTLAATNRQQLDALPSELREQYLKFRSMTFYQIGFSDSFVISVPLIEDEHGPGKAANSVWAALYGIAGVALTAMGIGIPLRAGIDIERGTDLFPNEVYGPVLINAYRLETTVAEYPRSVLGDGVLRYLSYLEGLPQTSPSHAYAARRRVDCRDLIRAAPDDGQPMLHILAPAILNLGLPLVEPAARAYDWVKKELAAHRASGNGKLQRRSTRLLRYFNASGFND